MYVDLKRLEESALCQLIDMATEELELRRSGVPPDHRIPPDVEAILQKARESIATNGKRLVIDAWKKLHERVEELLGKDLFGFCDLPSDPPEKWWDEQLGWEQTVSLMVPGICPVKFTYLCRLASYGDQTYWSEYGTSYDFWRVIVHPSGRGVRKGASVKIDEILLLAHQHAGKYYEALKEWKGRKGRRELRNQT